MSNPNDENNIANLEAEREEGRLKLDIAQQKALEVEAKKRYGSDWKRFFGNMKSGIDWSALKFRL
jgi:hypothetical protein